MSLETVVETVAVDAVKAVETIAAKVLELKAELKNKEDWVNGLINSSKQIANTIDVAKTEWHSIQAAIAAYTSTHQILGGKPEALVPAAPSTDATTVAPQAEEAIAGAACSV